MQGRRYLDCQEEFRFPGICFFLAMRVGSKFSRSPFSQRAMTPHHALFYKTKSMNAPTPSQLRQLKIERICRYMNVPVEEVGIIPDGRSETLEEFQDAGNADLNVPYPSGTVS